MKKIIHMIAVFIMVTVFFAAACVCAEAASKGTGAATVCEHSFTRQKATAQYLKCEASCTTKAVYYYSCEYCGKAGTETFEYGKELGHTRGSEWITTVLYHWRECTVCHERIDTMFHRPGAEATETTPQTCAVCGYTKAAVTIGKLAPAVTYGNNGKWSKGDAIGLTFKSNAAYKDFVKVLLDGSTIPQESYYKYDNYEGNIIIMLSASYLETLTEGKHVLAIRSASGDATADFTIDAGTESSSIDPMDILTWIAVVVIVLGAGVAEVVVIRKKKKCKQ